MYGIEISGLVRFLMQGGAAVAGAASLWGFILLSKGHKELAKILFRFFLAGLLVFLLGWFFSSSIYFAPDVYAHEGIGQEVSEGDLKTGIDFTASAVFASALLAVLFVLLVGGKGSEFQRYGGGFFLIQFLLISFFLVSVVHTGEFGREQFFFFLHNWHSILTFGTVIVVDFLYISTIRRDDLKRALYPFFPVMSSAIWIGLGIDFTAVLTVFPEALQVTKQSIFNQAVVAIIIINGALLSGKINDLLISLVKSDRVESLSARSELIFGISGSVSIVSWFTITFIDFFKFNLSYAYFFSSYLVLILIAFAFNRFLKRA